MLPLLLISLSDGFVSLDVFLKVLLLSELFYLLGHFSDFLFTLLPVEKLTCLGLSPDSLLLLNLWLESDIFKDLISGVSIFLEGILSVHMLVSSAFGHPAYLIGRLNNLLIPINLLFPLLPPIVPSNFFGRILAIINQLLKYRLLSCFSFRFLGLDLCLLLSSNHRCLLLLHQQFLKLSLVIRQEFLLLNYYLARWVVYGRVVLWYGLVVGLYEV